MASLPPAEGDYEPFRQKEDVMRNKQAITPYYGMALIALLMIFVFGCTNISGNYVESKKSALSESEMETSVETARSSPSANASDAGVSKDSGIPDSGTEPQTDGGTTSNKLFSEHVIELEKDSKPNQILKEYNNSSSVDKVRVVTINYEAFNKPYLKLNLFNNKEAIVENGTVKYRGPRNYSWFSQKDIANGEAVFSVVHGRVEGSFNIDHSFYRITPISEKYHVILDLDERNVVVSEDTKDWSEYYEIEEELEKSMERLREAGLIPKDNKGKNISKSGSDTVRMLLAYTTLAAEQVEDRGSTMTAESQYFIDKMNKSFENSDIDDVISVELARVVEFEYEECWSLYGNPIYHKLIDNQRFAYYREGVCCYDQNCGFFMDDVHTIRPNYSADINVLIRYPCEGGQALVVEASASTAFANCDNCNMESIGKAMTFNHEVGHLIGCCHHVEECEDDPACDPEEDDECYDSYEHGYCRDAGNPNYDMRTIMATSNYCSFTKANFWSDPDWEPVARGVEGESDCSRKITERASALAGFIPTPDDVDLEFDIKAGEYGYAIANDTIENDGNLTVEEDGELYLKANTITFKTGFTAENGSYVHAYR